MNIISTAKLAVASIYGYGLGYSANSTIVSRALYEKGLYQPPEGLSQEDVARLTAACDNVYEQFPEAVSLESNGSDRRIYGVDRLSQDPVFKELQQRFLLEAENFYGSTDLEQFCMAGDISFQADGLGSGSGWHRDSPFRHQFKVIIYLTDTTVEHGPFEFIPMSHSKKSLAHAARHLGKALSADRYTDAEVQQLIQDGVVEPSYAVTGPAGRIMYADTRGLHRGRPLQIGRRRAVTFYIYHKSIPQSISSVLAKA